MQDHTCDPSNKLTLISLSQVATVAEPSSPNSSLSLAPPVPSLTPAVSSSPPLTPIHSSSIPSLKPPPNTDSHSTPSFSTVACSFPLTNLPPTRSPRFSKHALISLLLISEAFSIPTFLFLGMLPIHLSKPQ